ncbi:MAG TPA: Nif3-like dinuclear metal center hexameric protein [Methylophilaceae bacterium]|nr:Nif3-like dinuclear metal center hexameric protein [Methylophilaceae bacterium]
MQLKELDNYIAQLLQPERFNDYCPNGLQVEGKTEIKSIVTGVTANMALLEAAQAVNADTILVHHGYFWRGESPVVTGIKKRRLQFLLAHDINLFAYHLPLDANLELGNNVMLGKVLEFGSVAYLDDKNMMPWIQLKQEKRLSVFADEVGLKLNRQVQYIGQPDKLIKTVAWCTGAAQSYIEQAILHDVDVFISGEISEQTVHMARESNTAYISAGHHATERYGIKALGEHLAEKFKLQHQFIDINNPI